jgi:hypothetical protein
MLRVEKTASVKLKHKKTSVCIPKARDQGRGPANMRTRFPPLWVGIFDNLNI